MASIVELARPKVNLTLRIRGRRADGYHEIDSLVAFADGAADVVTFTPGGEVGVTLSGSVAGAIQGENLAAAALKLMGETEPALVVGHIHLEKKLPVASGIGGGSADAAAVMRAVLRANPDHAALARWIPVAKRLGADVPVCLVNTAARMCGIGDVLEPLAGMTPLPAVLANPMVPVPADKTARVFRALGAGPVPSWDDGASAGSTFSTTADLVHFIEGEANDLMPPALSVVPEIGEVLRALAAEARCRFSRLSGAGPTCFGLFDEWRAADKAAARLAAAHPTWWVVPVVLG